jgi:hypothetical protein
LSTTDTDFVQAFKDLSLYASPHTLASVHFPSKWSNMRQPKDPESLQSRVCSCSCRYRARCDLWASSINQPISNSLRTLRQKEYCSL